eukprot:Phypoly_transcript_06724.p1 GENE.Phypoly_transcript_06724~~Phypoly_transcript_06724.p1  ORF type:complete len:352 (+),score=77.40 Phypoly_transcript_06724:60-1058(+)
MTDYKGGSLDTARILALEKQREHERKMRKAEMEKISEENRKPKVSTINEKFAKNMDTTAALLTQETVGLVSIEDFRRKREAVERLEQDETNKRKVVEEAAKPKAQNKKPKPAVSKLSFDLDEEEEQEGDGEGEKEESDKPPERTHKFGKDPKVNTSFLPDKDREESDAKERQRLTEEWLAEQERIKSESIEVTYSYWDGSGHRRELSINKGASIEQFLEQVRHEFKELRGVSAEHLLFIKEDLIIPHHHTFYDLIVSKARGKSGPLFHFDVHEDIRLLHDATVEKDESHAAKVVERRWYERNKHIFPASRWEVYDPTVQREKYTIHDRLKTN